MSRFLSDWKILDNNIAGPHSIASDGTLYVAEDTGRHGLKVYQEPEKGNFILTQTLQGIGFRPHRTLYHSQTQQFFVVGSADASIHVFKNVNGNLVKIHSLPIPELNGQYTRSITIQNNDLYFVGNSEIVKYKIDNSELKFTGKIIHLLPEYAGSNDVFFLNEHSGIFTSTPQKAYYFKSLDELGSGTAQNISNHFMGTPYYIEIFDSLLWIPKITEYSRIIGYPLDNGQINFSNKNILFDFGLPNDDSERQKWSTPL